MPVRAESTQVPLKAVIYATDFSECSENAGRYASLLARHFRAELIVSHAFVLEQAALVAEAQAGPMAKSAQRKETEAALANVAQRFSGGVKQSVNALLEGDPRELIPQLAQKNAPSIIVLGTSGRGKAERGLIGSVAERILRATAGPALTVGPHVPVLDPGATPFRRILYATDLTPPAAHGASFAVEIVNAFHGCMDVLHVVDQEQMDSPEQLSEIQKQFRVILDGLVPEHHAAYICTSKALVEVGSAHDRILEHLKKFSVDLLVLSIHKSSHLWLQARLSGAFQIIADAPCPVLTVTG
jgi:nucleotide-binding universal stress UspA family protein